MNKSSVETPFWFYVNDDGWNQSDSLKSILRGVSENERNLFTNTIGIALHTLLDAPLDEIANDMMEQILRFIVKLEK